MEGHTARNQGEREGVHRIDHDALLDMSAELDCGVIDDADDEVAIEIGIRYTVDGVLNRLGEINSDDDIRPPIAGETSGDRIQDL